MFDMMNFFKKKESVVDCGVKRTFRSAFVVSLCILLSRFTGLLRDIFFAKYLGSGIVAEAFYSAFRLPNTFRRIFAEGAFSNAFVPFFVAKVGSTNNKVANDFSFKVFCFLLCLLIGLTVFMEVSMPIVMELISPGFVENKEKFCLAVLLARVCFPYVVLISLTSFFGAILQSVGHFAPFSLVSVILNFVIVFGLFATNNLFSNIGLCLSWVLIFAGLLQLLFVLFFCIKAGFLPKNNKQFLLKKEVVENEKDLRSFLKKFISAVVSSGILQINIFVDGFFASFFAGAISYLYYSDRLIQFPMSIIGYSLSVAMLPALSMAFKEKNVEKVGILQTHSFNVALFFSLPATFLLLALSQDIVSLLFERGSFSGEDTRIVARMLEIFAFSIPFNVLNKILLACFYAQKNTRIPMFISLLSLIWNIVSNLVLYKFVGMYCVAFSTTLASILSYIICMVILMKTGNFFVGPRSLTGYCKIAFVSFLSCVILPFFANGLNVFIVLLLSGALYLILCFAFRILTKEFLVEIFVKKSCK